MLRPVSGEGTKRPSDGGDQGVGDALRSAIQRTLDATTPPQTRERASELLDEVARRGRDVRNQVARRGQEAGAELAKRGQEARDELGNQLEALEKRLASIEEALRRQGGEGSKPRAKDSAGSEGDTSVSESKREAES
jgi:hypothetical protein